MLRYSGKLPSSVEGVRRNDLISTFRLLKGEKYVPSKVHQAIRWKESDPFLSDDTDVPWRIVESSDKQDPGVRSKNQSISRVIQADGTQSTPLLGKRKLDVHFKSDANETASKKFRMCTKPAIGAIGLCVSNNPSNKAGPNSTTEHLGLVSNPKKD